MTAREILKALAVFLVLAVILGAGTEIVSTDSVYDEAFYVTKSMHLLDRWSNIDTIKEIGSPLFFALVRSVSIPLRVAFGLGYALSLLLLWRELRQWAFPAAACWAAALLPLFIPAQFKVFSEPTADPLLVVLWVCQLAACLALYRRGAGWGCTMLAGLVAVMTWLDRPEGILSAVSVIFIIALAVMKKRPGGGKRLPVLVSRAALVVAMQATAMIAVATLNKVYFGLPAATMMRDADFQRALKLLVSIDDGEPPRPYRMVSRRAMELALANSPAVASVKSYWENNYDYKGWSGNPPPMYDPGDGSPDGGHFLWAFRDSMIMAAGGNVSDELRYVKQVGDELQGAMDRGVLHRRFVFSSVLGPAATPFSARYWRSFFKVGRYFAAGAGPIIPPVDTAASGQDRMYDEACSRRVALIFKPVAHIRGWIVMEAPPHVPESISPAVTSRDVSFNVENRPDVVRTLFGGQTGPAECGFSMDGPADLIRDATLIVSGNGVQEHLAFPQWRTRRGMGGVQGHVRFYLDEVRDLTNPPRRWAVMNKWGSALSRCMSVAGVASLVAFAGIVSGMRKEAGWRKTRNDFLVASLVTAVIVLPRWVLFAAFDSYVYAGIAPRYMMPFTALAWAWEGLALGIAVVFLIWKIRSRRDDFTPQAAELAAAGRAPRP